MIDDAKRAEDLRAQLQDELDDSLWYGRWTHRTYLFLAFVTVASSALSAILALGFTEQEVDRRLIGAIALIPGICAGVSDRFHLLLKKHWYYRRYDKVNALVRRMDFVLSREPSHAEIADVAEDLCRIDRQMSRAWEQLEEPPQPATAKPK